MPFDRGDRELLLVKPAVSARRPVYRVLHGLRCTTAHWWCLPLPLVAGGTMIALLCLEALR